MNQLALCIHLVLMKQWKLPYFLQDNILITIGGTGLDASADTADPYIVVHPNYVE